MTLGQIEIVVLGFPGNKFNGKIGPRIEDLIKREVIRVVDALLIVKDDAGDTVFVELDEPTDDPEAAALSAFMEAQIELLADEDVEAIAEELDPGSSALMLVFEHIWMKPVRDAIVDSGGVLLADIHVPPEVVDTVLDAMAQL